MKNIIFKTKYENVQAKFKAYDIHRVQYGD